MQSNLLIIPPPLPLHNTMDNNQPTTVSVCDADNSDMSIIIPIIVGAVLAVLIVIVIIAYVVGRTRANNENSYDAI